MGGEAQKCYFWQCFQNISCLNMLMEYKRKTNAAFTTCEMGIFHESSPTELHRRKGSSKFVGAAEGITSSLVRQDVGNPGLLLQHFVYGNPSCYCSNFCKLCSTYNVPDVPKPGLFLHQFLSDSSFLKVKKYCCGYFGTSGFLW